jgi:dTMP kinase
MPSILLAALLAIPMGIGVGTTWVTGYTLLQENVSDEFRGRTFATLTVSARMTLFFALVAFPSMATALQAVPVGGHELGLKVATRISLWTGGLVVVGAALATRTGLKRHRLAKPQPLKLMPRFRKVDRAGGLFIVFEGVEGSGKGTQMELTRQWLASEGRDVLVTREPGGTELGDRLRDALLDPATGTIDPRAEALMFAAGRAQHVTSVIRPALEEGKVVLCDRFVDSSLAYQGVGRGAGEQDILTLNAWATQGLFPDVVILLNIDPEKGLARAASQGADRIESEALAFHARVSDAYLRLADENPDRFRVIDAEGTPQEVHHLVVAALRPVVAREPQGPAGPT